MWYVSSNHILTSKFRQKYIQHRTMTEWHNENDRFGLYSIPSILLCQVYLFVDLTNITNSIRIINWLKLLYMNFVSYHMSFVHSYRKRERERKVYLLPEVYIFRCGKRNMRQLLSINHMVLYDAEMPMYEINGESHFSTNSNLNSVWWRIYEVLSL